MIVLTIEDNIKYCDMNQMSQKIDYLCCYKPYCPKCGGSGCVPVTVYPFSLVLNETTFRTIWFTLGLEGESVDPKELLKILDQFDELLLIKKKSNEEEITQNDAYQYVSIIAIYCKEAIHRNKRVVWYASPSC